jgi:hypothetical protein
MLLISCLLRQTKQYSRQFKNGALAPRRFSERVRERIRTSPLILVVYQNIILLSRRILTIHMVHVEPEGEKHCHGEESFGLSEKHVRSA